MSRDLDVNKPLRSLNFSHLIGSPLLACIDAQEKAAQCSREYIEEVGLETDDDGVWKPMMTARRKPSWLPSHSSRMGRPSS